MKDIAEMAGVSAITVSRALSQPEKASAATRAHIEAVVRRIGHVPTGVAGSRASSRSRVIAALVPMTGESIFAETVRGLGDTLRTMGHQMMPGENRFSPTMEEDRVAAALSRRPAVLMRTGCNHTPRTRDMLRDAGLPAVETRNLGDTATDTLVGFSNGRSAIAGAKLI